MAESDSAGCGWAIIGLIVFSVCYGSSDKHLGEAQKGDLSLRGGSPTVRREFEPERDDAYTSNDESNDQPVGYFGTKTLSIAGENGNTYTLDGELDGLELQRVYFPSGGWVDFLGRELEPDFSGYCSDEEGRFWTIYGEAAGYMSSAVVEEQEGDAEESSYGDPYAEEEGDEGRDGEPDDLR